MASETSLSHEYALDQLHRVQHHQIHLSQAGNHLTGISNLTDIHNQVLAALILKNQSIHSNCLYCSPRFLTRIHINQLLARLTVDLGGT